MDAWREQRDLRKSQFLTAATVLTVISIILATMFDVVGYDQVGLLVDEFSRKVLDGGKTYETGQHITGLGKTFILFNKTIHTIDMRFEGGGSASDNVGGAASNPNGGPVTIRTIDGQMIDIELSVQYRLDTEKLYDLYKAYGLEYNDFATSIVRSKSRDEAANHPANAFFKLRNSIQSSLEDSIKSALTAVNMKLVSFQLLNVFLPTALEVTIKKIQEAKLSVQLKQTQLLTTEIEANTSLAVKQVTSRTSKLITEYDVATTNQILKKDMELALLQEATSATVESRKASNEGAIQVIDAETEVILANKTAEIKIIQAKTDKLVVNITNAENQVKAEYSKMISETKATAIAKAFETTRNATSEAKKRLASAYSTAYSTLAAQTFAASDINHLEWASFFSAHPADKLHMDLSQPAALYLDDQQSANHDANMRSRSEL